MLGGDDLETWTQMAQLNAKAESRVAPAATAVQRDGAAPYCAHPDAEALLDALGGVCSLTSRALPAAGLGDWPLPVGLLYSPFAAAEAYARVDDACPLCTGCGAPMGCLSGLNTRAQWLCRWCGTHNASDARHGPGAAAQQWTLFAELSHAAVEWREGSAAHLVSAWGPTVVLVVDATLPAPDARATRAAVVAALERQLDAAWAAAPQHVALVTFDSVVQVHMLDAGGAAASALCFGAGPLNATTRDRLAEHRHRLRVPLTREAVAAVRTALEALAPGDHSRKARRELGAALALGDGLCPSGQLLARHRLVVVVAGPPAACAWGELQLEAAAVDLVALSSHTVGLAALDRALPRPSAWPSVVLTHSVPDAPRALQQTLERLVAPVARTDARVAVRVGDGARVTQLLSPALRPDSSLAAVEERETVAALVSCERPGALSYMPVQLEASFVDLLECRVVRRVVTFAWPRVPALATFHQGLAAEPTAALMTRVLWGSSVPLVLGWVDATMRKCVRCFGAAGLPASLEQLPYLTYALRSHPVGVQGGDDHWHSVAWLARRCPVSECVHVLVPRMLRWAADGTPHALPPEDLCLQDGSVLLMDTHAHLLLWSGAATTNADGDAARAHALRHAMAVAATRVPPPLLIHCRSGEGTQRWLEAQLSPAHKDGVAAHAAQFPELQALSADAARAWLDAAFMPTDEPSFVQWWRQLTTTK